VQFVVLQCGSIIQFPLALQVYGDLQGQHAPCLQLPGVPVGHSRQSQFPVVGLHFLSGEHFIPLHLFDVFFCERCIREIPPVTIKILKRVKNIIFIEIIFYY
jgi:hypothetical protein